MTPEKMKQMCDELKLSPADVARHLTRTVRHGDLMDVLDAQAPIISGFFVKAVQPLVDRLVFAEQRVKDLEERPVLLDAGVWAAEKTYPAGSLVSDRGAGWIAQVETKGIRPGDGRLWRLAIKSQKERAAR